MREGRDGVLGQGAGIVVVAAVEMRLAAAGLTRRNEHFGASASMDAWTQFDRERGFQFEIVAEDALGLLYRMSRVMSESGCDVDLVLISTEGRRAIDVFHLTRGGAKLSPPQQQELTANLQRVLEGRT